MLDKMLIGLLLIVGIINFLPFTGLFLPARMQAMYGVDLSDPNLMILMRHRALLFGLIGGFILMAAFNPVMQPAALVLGCLSMVGFVVIGWQVGSYNAGISQVMVADGVGILALFLAAVLYAYLNHYRG